MLNLLENYPESGKREGNPETRIKTTNWPSKMQMRTVKEFYGQREEGCDRLYEVVPELRFHLSPSICKKPLRSNQSRGRLGTLSVQRL